MTARYQIINHGPDYPCYWQGQGVSYTPFGSVSTGIGDNARDAYDDAVESIATAVGEGEFRALRLPKRPRGIRQRDRVSKGAARAGAFWYVSILYTLRIKQ